MENLKANESKDLSIKEKINKMKNSNINAISQNKKSILKIILIISISFLILITVFIVIFFSLAKKKKKGKEIENKIISQKNYIEASYNVEEGKEMTIINSNEINLKDEDYYIELIDKLNENNNNFRNLKIIEIKNGIYKPEISGILS